MSNNHSELRRLFIVLGRIRQDAYILTQNITKLLYCDDIDDRLAQEYEDKHQRLQEEYNIINGKLLQLQSNTTT